MGCCPSICASDDENGHLLVKLSKTEFDNLQSRRDSLEAMVTKLRQKSQGLEKDKTELEKTKKELEGMNGQLKKHCNELSDRLSSEISTKVSKDESVIENVSVKNRPMNVADEYMLLCSGPWLEAKGAVDEVKGGDEAGEITEQDRIVFLSNIMVSIEYEVKKVHNAFLKEQDGFLSTVSHPMTLLKDSGNGKSDEASPAQVDVQVIDHQRMAAVTNVVNEEMRNAADAVDIKALIQKIYGDIESSIIIDTGSTQTEDGGQPDTHPYQHMWTATKHSQQMKSFIDATTRIFWKMALQKPSMELRHCSGAVFDEGYMEKAWGSVEEVGVRELVVYEVYPALYHGKKLMAKGKVYVLKK